MPPLRLSWGLASPPHPHGSVVRFTPVFGERGRLRRIFHESHHLARCSKWAHLHFSSACACRAQISWRVLDVLVVVEVLESRAPRASAPKPCKGAQNTTGGERSVTPGNSGTRQRVPRELGSPRDPSRLTGSVAAKPLTYLFIYLYFIYLGL